MLLAVACNETDRTRLAHDGKTWLGFNAKETWGLRYARCVAAKPGSKSAFVLFDVFYEDGSRRSNRKVPAEILGGLEEGQPVVVGTAAAAP